jgi:RHS repeat-associated protein
MYYRGARLIAIEGDAQTEERRFDQQARLVAIERRFHGERPFTITESFRYRPDGRLAARTLADGSVLRSRTNSAGQVVALDWFARPGSAAVTIVSAIEADPLGTRSWTYGNGVRYRATRSASGRLLGMVYQTPAGKDLLRLKLAYDALGNVIAESHGKATSEHRYDPLGRMVTTRSGDGVGRFAYDADGNRIASQAPVATNPVSLPTEPLQRDAAGRVITDARHRYRWNADGRLAEVRRVLASADAAPIALYEYNSRGERVSARNGSAAHTTNFLYQDGLVSAELDRDGRVLRHYFHFQGVPVATIDLTWEPERRAADGRPVSTTVTFLHSDHLRAPVLATDGAGRPIWRGSRQAFGESGNDTGSVNQARQAAMPGAAPGYRQPLAFAGQYRDTATGLHYNLQRYYNPSSGRYLSPDPLGPLASTNAYAYADSNPRSGIDPLGLVLFAFDGTGKTPDALTNVSWLANYYRDNPSGILGATRPFYEPGPGSGWWAAGDSAFAYTLSLVVARQLKRLDDYLLATVAQAASLTGASLAPLSATIDVVGFSRGAAAGRSFANQVAERERDGYYLRLLKGRCADMELRFMGLFDTVLSIAAGSFELGIPQAVAYAAQAVAVNEHRTLFPLESIEPDFSAIGASPARVELGFIGAHSDVGGGYACESGCDGGDLSDIALNWMIEQARGAGVTMAVLPPAQRVVTNPVLHNEVYALPYSAWGSDQDRVVRYPNASNAPTTAPLQRSAPIAGLDTATSSAFIISAPDPDQHIAGSVDLDAYRSWLASSYGVVIGP